MRNLVLCIDSLNNKVEGAKSNTTTQKQHL